MSSASKKKSASEELADIAEVRSDLRIFVKRRMFTWAVRWAIGFGVIWVTVTYFPNLSWLWGAGGVLAFVSLVSILVGLRLIHRRLNQAEQRAKGASLEPG